MVEKTYQIIYGSNIIIRNAVELATLCVFYDKTLLPHASRESSRRHVGYGFFIEFPETVAGKKVGNELFDAWSDRYQILFDEQVLERLPPPVWNGTPPDGVLQTIDPSERLSVFTRVPIQSRFEIDSDIPGKPMLSVSLIPQDLALHFLRKDLQLPQVFIGDGRRPSRELLVASEAKVVFSYLLPALSVLEPEQILEVRDKVKDTREGFSMHLQKLSKGVEDRLVGGESASEIELWAKRMIETELIPDYREFRRQLGAEKSGRWASILDKGSKIFEIDASPFTPKFYGELLKMLGVAFTYNSESKEKLSNRSQAFQFMRLMEDSNR